MWQDLALLVLLEGVLNPVYSMLSFQPGTNFSSANNIILKSYDWQKSKDFKFDVYVLSV